MSCNPRPSQALASSFARGAPYQVSLYIRVITCSCGHVCRHDVDTLWRSRRAALIKAAFLPSEKMIADSTPPPRWTLRSLPKVETKTRWGTKTKRQRSIEDVFDALTPKHLRRGRLIKGSPARWLHNASEPFVAVALGGSVTHGHEFYAV